MLDLTKVTKASPSQEKLVFWAKMFNATTQEEFDMLATENQLTSTMSDAMKKFYEQKNIADQCRAREDYYNRRRAEKDLKDRLKAQIAEQANTISAQIDTVSMQASEISEKDARIAELEALLASKGSK